MIDKVSATTKKEFELHFMIVDTSTPSTRGGWYWDALRINERGIRLTYTSHDDSMQWMIVSKILPTNFFDNNVFNRGHQGARENQVMRHAGDSREWMKNAIYQNSNCCLIGSTTKYYLCTGTSAGGVMEKKSSCGSAMYQFTFGLFFLCKNKEKEEGVTDKDSRKDMVT
jgi:hypothetical protein